MKIVALDIGGTSIKSGIWNGAGVEEVREPVSYTHLDVYKRQVLHWCKLQNR